jgi:DGQHR domain-containing protein
MTNVQKLEGDKLEDWFKDLFKNEFKLKNYYASSGQIELTELDPAARKGEHLEFDGILLLNRTAVLFEFTAEKSGIKNKIKKFTRSCHLFTTSPNTLRERFALFNSIPAARLSDFEEVQDWRFAFFGTSKEIDEKKITTSNFSECTVIRDKLSIFGAQIIEYISELTELINQYAKYEFLSALDLSPNDLGQSTLIQKKYLKAENRYVTENENIKADIYLLSFTAKELLEIGRVSRYEGIPLALDTEGKIQYQRFLLKSKLSNIANKFIKKNHKKSFPNTVTLVLSDKCKIDPSTPDELLIPNIYSSVDIIDGQHRIFAYADKSITPAALEKSVIFASAIKFKTNNHHEINKLAAKIFCEINSKQAKVKNDLLYLIKYDVLGEKDPIAIAGKVILECNRDYKKPLGGIFLINTLIKKNKFNLSPIPIVTIVVNDLCKFLNGEGLENILEPEGFTDIFDKPKGYLNRYPDKWWKKGKDILEEYFFYIRSTFPNDWREDSTSNLLSAKYISALIRLLRDYMIDQDLSLSEIKTELESIRSKVNKVTIPSAGQPSFPRNDNSIPSTNYKLPIIYGFLKNPKKKWQ